MRSIDQSPSTAAVAWMAIVAVATLTLASPLWAAEEHPRKAEVMNRDRHLAGKMNKDYGNLSGHYNQLQKQDAAIRKQAQTEFKQNGGHLTKAQTQQLNAEENHLNGEIKADRGSPPKTQFEQEHPRRAEVVHRDSRINGTLNADAGKLGGNLPALKQQQQSIRQQEQADAKANGGYITRSQQQQLNAEENQLNQEIKTDRGSR
jgi:F0F1-type ATP synthase membrane subunit b/b'